jgi:hypothetical protein
MATWFAPTIIISIEETALSVMLLSFNACLKNLLPFNFVWHCCFYIVNYSCYTTYARLFGADPSSQR